MLKTYRGLTKWFISGTESPKGRDYAGEGTLRKLISSIVEEFCNPQRQRPTLGELSPGEFETKH